MLRLLHWRLLLVWPQLLHLLQLMSLLQLLRRHLRRKVKLHRPENTFSYYINHIGKQNKDVIMALLQKAQLPEKVRLAVKVTKTLPLLVGPVLVRRRVVLLGVTQNPGRVDRFLRNQHG